MERPSITVPSRTADLQPQFRTQRRNIETIPLGRLPLGEFHLPQQQIQVLARSGYPGGLPGCLAAQCRNSFVEPFPVVVALEGLQLLLHGSRGQE